MIVPFLEGQKEVNKWTVSVDYGIQKHDKRLYHWPKLQAQTILARAPEEYGTYQWSLSLYRKIVDYKGIEVLPGIGISRERATFFRPFNQNYGRIGSNIGRYTDEYTQVLLQMPLQLKYDFFDKGILALGVEISPQFNFFTKADHSTDEFGYEPYTWWGFYFYSIEFNPEIVFSFWRLHFGMKYRAFQVKKVDPILFWSADPSVIKKMSETYNPFKLWFTVGYEF